jgi:cation transport ATPase
MAQLVNEDALRTVIDHLELSDEQKQRVKDRWLNYVVWWDSRASKNRRKHYWLRTIVVIGGVIIPALIGTAAAPNLSGIRDEQINVFQWAAFSISLLVGIAAALEELYRYGEIWREKRAAAEVLKCEGWRYFQLVGKYKTATHINAYEEFASTVEDMIEREIKDYFLIHKENEKPGKPFHEKE